VLALRRRLCARALLRCGNASSARAHSCHAVHLSASQYHLFVTARGVELHRGRAALRSQRPSSDCSPAAHPLTRIPTNATQHGGAGCSDLKHTSAARSRVHDRPAEHVWEQRVPAHRRHRPPACNLARWRFSAIPKGCVVPVAKRASSPRWGPVRPYRLQASYRFGTLCSPQTTPGLFPLRLSAGRRRGPLPRPPQAPFACFVLQVLIRARHGRSCSNYVCPCLARFAFAYAPSIASKPFPRPATTPLVSTNGYSTLWPA
jgi:hypothetical protein